MGYTICKKAEIGQLKEELNTLKTQIEQANTFIKKIEDGNLQFSIDSPLVDSTLGNALEHMRSHLQSIAKQENERNWITNGIATFSDILRSRLSMDEFGNEVLTKLVRYLEVNQAAFFVYHQDEENPEGALRLLACYAYKRKKFLAKEIKPGEGLVGQCFLEREPIFIKEIPQNYVNITSGLGEATPSNLLLIPLLVNDEIYGVLEFASFTEIEDYKREFLTRFSESLASTIYNRRTAQKTEDLLKQTQVRAEQLKSAEEELRQNMEEMSATQEELQRRNKEAEEKDKEMQEMMLEMKVNEEDMQRNEQKLRKLMKDHQFIQVQFEEQKNEIEQLNAQLMIVKGAKMNARN